MKLVYHRLAVRDVREVLDFILGPSDRSFLTPR